MVFAEVSVLRDKGIMVNDNNVRRYLEAFYQRQVYFRRIPEGYVVAFSSEEIMRWDGNIKTLERFK